MIKLKKITILLSGTALLLTVLVLIPSECLNQYKLTSIIILISLMVIAISLIPVFKIKRYLPTLLFIVIMVRMAAIILSSKALFMTGINTGIIIPAGIMPFSSNIHPAGALLALLIISIFNYSVLLKYIFRTSAYTAQQSIDSLPGLIMIVEANAVKDIIDKQSAEKKKETIIQKTDLAGACDGLSRFMRIETYYIYTFILLLLLFHISTSYILKSSANTGSLLIIDSITGMIIIMATGISYFAVSRSIMHELKL